MHRIDLSGICHARMLVDGYTAPAREKDDGRQGDWGEQNISEVELSVWLDFLVELVIRARLLTIPAEYGEELECELHFKCENPRAAEGRVMMASTADSCSQRSWQRRDGGNRARESGDGTQVQPIEERESQPVTRNTPLCHTLPRSLGSSASPFAAVVCRGVARQICHHRRRRHRRLQR
jgi:hypothetical protein